jgi:hypothetical protein
MSGLAGKSPLIRPRAGTKASALTRLLTECQVGFRATARTSPASRPTSNLGCAEHNNSQRSRLLDGSLPLRQELHKLGTAPGSLLVRTIFDSDVEQLDETRAFPAGPKYDLAGACSDSANPR